MTTIFHAWPYGRFIDTEEPQEKETLQNESSYVLGGSVSNRDIVIQFGGENQPQHLKRCFSPRTDPSIFTSIAPVLLDRSNETS